MSRIVLATYGSLGDLHPVMALALELQRRDHHVALATSEPYRAKIESAGLPFAPIRPDLSLTDEAMVRRVMDGVRGTDYLMRKLVYPAVREMFDDLLPLARNADLLVSTELVCAAPLLGEKHGVRWAFAALSPISFFTTIDPPVLPGPAISRWLQRLGPGGSRFIHRIAKTMSYPWWTPVRALRRELGLPRGRSPIFEGKWSPVLNLALFSPVLQKPQPDWPAHTLQAGFLFFEETDAPGTATVSGPDRADATGGGRGPTLPDEVARFLDAGAPPIVFTLGSAAVMLARDFYHQAARAAQSLGCRAMLLLGRNPPPPRLPASILAWNYLPYAQIFPRAAAIVHQGGVGTTAQALRAGKPMLIVPFAHDQFDNAARIARLGAGRTLSRSRCTAGRLARELAALLGDSGCGQAAAEIGARVRAENGVARAADAIEHAARAA